MVWAGFCWTQKPGVVSSWYQWSLNGHITNDSIRVREIKQSIVRSFWQEEMKYHVQSRVLPEKVSKIGHWTMWHDRLCQVKEIVHVPVRNCAVLSGIEHPVQFGYLSRFVKVIYPSFIENGAPTEFVIDDDSWAEFVGIINDSQFTTVRTTEYGNFTHKAVIRKNHNVGLETVKAVLNSDELPPASHDDMFKNGELIKGAIFSITGNPAIVSAQLPKRSDNEWIKVLSEAASTLICEIDRIQRKQNG